MIRHFRYASIGFYAVKAEHANSNGGFKFIVALPPYKYKRHKYIPRVSTSLGTGITYNAGNEKYYYKMPYSNASDNIMQQNSFNPYFIKSELFFIEMKKKSFLSGIGAKLALAAVALTTVVFTSCEKEEFNVEPVELSPASATIVATVYDLTTGEVLAPQAIVETITAGTDGTIAATTKEISCPSFSNAEYLPVEAITVAIPKLAKGQFALIPVNFYAQKIVSAAKNVTVSEDPTTIETTEVKNTPVTYGPYDVDKNIDIEYAAKVGSEVVNINAINSYIETLVNSRAMSNENVIKVLKAVVGTYNTGIKTEMQKETRTIKAQTTVTFSPVTTIIESVVTVTATVDGVEYTIPNVQLRKAGATVVSESSESHAGHDHGHGDNSNSGGGAGGR